MRRGRPSFGRASRPGLGRIRLGCFLVRAGSRDVALVRMWHDAFRPGDAELEALSIALPPGRRARASAAEVPETPELIASGVSVLCQVRRRSCGYDAGTSLLVLADERPPSLWNVTQRRSRDRIDAGEAVTLRGAGGATATLRFEGRRASMRIGVIGPFPVRVVDGPVPGLFAVGTDPVAVAEAVVAWGGPDAPLRLSADVLLGGPATFPSPEPLAVASRPR